MHTYTWHTFIVSCFYIMNWVGNKIGSKTNIIIARYSRSISATVIVLSSLNIAHSVRNSNDSQLIIPSIFSSIIFSSLVYLVFFASFYFHSSGSFLITQFNFYFPTNIYIYRLNHKLNCTGFCDLSFFVKCSTRFVKLCYKFRIELRSTKLLLT